jgi:hypothetical protein
VQSEKSCPCVAAAIEEEEFAGLRLRLHGFAQRFAGVEFALLLANPQEPRQVWVAECIDRLDQKERAAINSGGTRASPKQHPPDNNRAQCNCNGRTATQPLCSWPPLSLGSCADCWKESGGKTATLHIVRHA